MRKLPRKAPAGITPARYEAFMLLLEMENSSHAHADELLRRPRLSELSTLDRNLCTTLVMGTLRWQLHIDSAIRTLLSKPNARLDSAIQIALRLGTFQLHYLDRIPAHAAISESVNLAKIAGHQHASRMVNAVLRRIAERPRPASLPSSPSPEQLAEATAHPLWLVERWAANYGLEQARAICEHGQQQPELSLRLESREAEAELAVNGMQLAPGAILTDARRILNGDVTATEAFQSGRVRIQEEGSQLIAELSGGVTPLPRRILDCCAAPGGKTLILAELNPQAQITACEINLARLEALKARISASPYATRIEVRQADAAEPEEIDSYDLVLADVPCSGTGTLGRNPEIRHRLQPADLVRHHERQCAILHGALRASTGRVIYSTCSLEPEENSAVVAEVLAQSPGWRQIPVSEVIKKLQKEGRLTSQGSERLKNAVAPDGSLTLLPGSLGPEAPTDGFFIAVLEKQK
ncbi:transcription antitermination factor NusB [Acidicapsa acidisoli]|uniref:transcription antitermination factor NusB n=1 Tax=Acidicapsa acidisoli TaxID=1615681 RepID=UPI0021DFEDA8|nr:transcription antitermination factor NusB [Acidicapsa acidisoli]